MQATPVSIGEERISKGAPLVSPKDGTYSSIEFGAKWRLTFMDDRHDAIFEYDTMGHSTLIAMHHELARNK